MRKRIFIFSILIILAAQLNINLYNSSFKISIAITLFSVFSFIFGKIPIPIIALISAPGVFISRILTYLLQYESSANFIALFAPEILFYIIYGLLIYAYYSRLSFKFDSWIKLIPIILIDYTANLSEMLIRNGLFAFSFKIQYILISVAVVRTFIIMCLYLAFEYQNIYILKREHANRYKNLLFLISKLKTEIVWMDKNTSSIEETMNTSYKLYQSLCENEKNALLSEQALSVAKDIHEIKKEYNLIKRGISEALNDSNNNDKGMDLKEIFYMIKEKLDLDLSCSGKKIDWSIQIDSNFFTSKHYFFLSILRNLLDNAIEASETNTINNENNTIKIEFVTKEINNTINICISDYGKGIDDEYKDMIFSPGFSTKINYNTGVVNRGLGLSLVKDIVTNNLNGKIEFLSENHKTTFTIILPKELVLG